MSDRATLRRILHCDMDCYYAAVHMRDEPRLRGRPVVVGGDPEGRGVVASASYEARRFGIHSAMPASRAKRLCPEAVFLRPDFPRYRRESERIFAIYREFTPLVETVSLDEAYLDVTEHLGRLDSATAIGREIRRRVKTERDLTVSVGIGPNKLVAKIASDFRKPDGLTVVPPDRVLGFLAPLPVRTLHGVGPSTEHALTVLGAATVAHLREIPIEALVSRFHSHGRTLHDHARGVDERPVVLHHERKSLGTETTYAKDVSRLETLDDELSRMAEEVAQGLAHHQLAACTVTVKVRFTDFQTVTRSRTSAVPTAAAARIVARARELVRRTDAGRRPVRLLGVSTSTLVPGSMSQPELFEES